MIEELRLDVSADELFDRLDRRIADHRARADAFSAQARSLAEIQTHVDDDDDDDATSLDAIVETPQQKFESRRKAHLDRVGVLTFLRDHIVKGEVYRLSEEDLRTLEILPRRFGLW